MKLSARNQLKGKIVDVKKGTTTAHVRIDIGGQIVTAAITNECAEELKLAAGQTGLCRDQGERCHGRRRLARNAARPAAAIVAGLAATLLAPALRAARATVTDAAGRAVPIPDEGDARVSGRAAGRDPALHAGARPAARLAARQPAGGMRVHAAGHLRAAGSRPHHRPRQHRQSRSRARAQARPHPRRRLDQRDLRLARRRACRSRPAFPMRCSTAASTRSRRPIASSAS